MPENLFNSAHKATNQTYRDGYDRTFGIDVFTLAQLEKCREFARKNTSRLFKYHQDFKPYYKDNDILPLPETKRT